MATSRHDVVPHPPRGNAAAEGVGQCGSHINGEKGGEKRMTHLLRILGRTADGFLIAIHSPPAREREVCTVTVQALSVTVTVLGN